MQIISKEPLTIDELKQLHSFLSSDHDNAEPMSITRSHGFLTAVISAPTLIMPSQWLPVLFDSHPGFESEEQAINIISLINRFYNDINQGLKSNNDTFNPLFFHDDDSKPTEQETLDLAYEWCVGYIEGAGLDEFWSEDDAGIELLYPFAILADEVSLIGRPKKDGSIIQDDLPEKKKIVENLPKYIKDIHDQWMKIRTTIEKKRQQSFICSDESDDDDGFPYERDGRKIGRNEPCPCGSGKKYKKCCVIKNESLH